METPNKRNKWKNIVIVVLCSVILIFSALFVFWNSLQDAINHWNNRDYHTTYNDGVEEVAVAVEAYEDVQFANVASGCDEFFFYGDTGYLVKGPLLDATAKTEYDQLPDTIALILYGDRLAQVPEPHADSESKQAHFKPLKAYGDNHPLTAYLELAEQEKVELLKLLPNRQGSLEVADGCYFPYQYGNYFNPEILTQRNTPLPIKKALVAYLKSDEGGDYQFVNDRRKAKQVYHLGNFTGIDPYTQKPARNLAAILTEKSSDGSFRERIVVAGFDTDSQEGEILFNEVFYNSKLLINVYDSPANLPDEARSLARFVTPSKQLIQVKMDNSSSIYLYYDEEFDTMVRKSFPEYEEGCERC